MGLIANQAFSKGIPRLPHASQRWIKYIPPFEGLWAISWGGEGSKLPRIVREGGALKLSNATNRYLLYLGPPQSLSPCGCREHWCFSWVWWALAVEQGLETERGIDGEIAFASESCVSVPAFPLMSVSNNWVMVFHFEEFICPRGFVSFCLAFEGSESFQARRTLRHHLLNPSFDRWRNWASEKARGSLPSVTTFPGGRAGAWNPSPETVLSLVPAVSLYWEAMLSEEVPPKTQAHDSHDRLETEFRQWLWEKTFLYRTRKLPGTGLPGEGWESS